MATNSQDVFPLEGPYADRNRLDNLGGPGDSRVTGAQIIKDEGLEGKLSDKVILVTGVSSGMGVETVRNPMSCSYPKATWLTPIQ